MAKGQKTGGRVAGTPNTATREVKALAGSYGPAAVKALAKLAGLTKEGGAESEAARVAAIKEILDRAYGKAAQIVAGDADAPLIFQEIRRTFVRPGHSNS